MTLKISKIIHILLYLCIILEFPWIRIADMPQIINSYASIYQKELILYIGILALLLIILIRKRNLILKGFLLKYVLFVCLITIFVILCSWANYSEQSLRESFVSGHHIFLIVLAPVFMYIFQNNGYEKVCNLLNIFAFTWCLLCLIQAVIYPISGIVILQNIDKEWLGFFDSNLLRISLLGIPNLMVLYNFSLVIEKKAKPLNYLYCILGVVCVLLVQQTRAFIIAIVVSILFMFMVRSQNPLKFIRNVIIIAVVATLVMSSEYFQSLIASFTSSSNKVASTTNRQYAYGYYFRCFLSNPLFGNGFASSNLYPEVVHGSLGMAYYSDCGVIGLLAQMGIWGGFIYGTYILRMLSIVLKLFGKGKLHDNSLAIGITVFTILTSYSLSYTSPAYSILFPLCLAWIEYIYLRSNTMNALKF